MTNACYDAGRRRARRPAWSLDALVDPEQEDGGVEIADPGPLPETEALRGETAALLQAALLELPFDQRTAVVLSDVHGLSYDEIAEATATSLGTIKSRLSRARARLRDILRSGGAIGEHNMSPERLS